VKRRLHVPAAQLGLGNPVELTAPQARYLETVLRLRAGDVIEVFDGEGRRFHGVLESAGLRVGAELPREAPFALDFWLAQALVKGDKLDLVVQKATELGASRIVLLDSNRSVVKLEERRAVPRIERLQRIAEEAARQCGRSDVPRIDGPLSLDDLCELLGPDRLGLLLDPGEPGLRLSHAARGVSRVCVVVGPEGGFAPEEREHAASMGFVPVSLGNLVLRTETAGVVALAIVKHLAGDLG
jgi:16S rRNA (uracil1498-N3)-methyltransferase